MKTKKYNPKLLGVAFFIVALTCLISSTLFISTIGTGSISESLSNIYENMSIVLLSFLVDLFTCVGIIVLGVQLFLTLKEQNNNIAHIALGFYLSEAIILAVSKIFGYFLLHLSIEYVNAGTPDTSYFQSLGTVLLKSMRYGYTLHMLFFGLGGILFYYLFYRSKLIPKLFSIWGLIAVLLTLVGTFFMFFDIELGMMIYLPEGLFELVIGVYLIFYGFRNVERS